MTALSHPTDVLNKELPKNSASRISRTKETLSIVATAIPVLGLLGTGGLWAANNFYVGDVNVTTDKPFHNITVKAFDKKGQESTFHTPHFQLMPGNYHLEISVDGQAEHTDTVVAYQKQSDVRVASKETSQEAMTNSEELGQSKKRHWWQLWRR